MTKLHLRNSLSIVALVCAAAVALAPLHGLAQAPAPQASPPAATPPAPAAQPAPDAAAQQPQPEQFTQAELRKLLAPIALYPDALLAQVLPASAYPVQIVQLQRWLDKNKAAVEKSDFSKVDAQSWDPAVKALARFPTVVKKLNDDLDWTTDLGDAVVNQPQDVADAIQYLRAQAEKAGALKSTPQQKVTRTSDAGREFIAIEPVDPGVVYVPIYDAATIFDPGVAIAAGLITFGTGIAVASMWNGNYWNWRTGAIFPPVWPGYPAWRPPYPGWRPGVPPPPRPPGGWPGDRPGIGGDRPGIGGDRPGIGNRPGDRPGLPGDRPGIGGRPPGDRPGLPGGGNIGNDLKPWRPGPDYRPGLGSKPGIGDRPTTRPAPQPGGGAKPSPLPGGGARPAPLPGGGGAARPAPLPGGGAAARPAPLPGGGAKPAARPAPKPANRPAARPQGPRPPNGSAMSGIGMGPGNQMFSNRGAASRQMGPPGGMRPGGMAPGGRPGGGAGMRPGGGPRPGGGGMGPRPGGGGGGAMRGGGGRRR